MTLFDDSALTPENQLRLAAFSCLVQFAWINLVVQYLGLEGKSLLERGLQGLLDFNWLLLGGSVAIVAPASFFLGRSYFLSLQENQQRGGIRWTRGFFRLWIVSSSLWILFCLALWLATDDITGGVAAAVAAVPPTFVLCLGMSIVWALRGFLPPSPSAQ